MTVQELEKVTIHALRKGNAEAFSLCYDLYFSSLCAYANLIIHNRESAEEIVQDFFVKLWEKREQLFIETSIKNYFFRSVKNLCINFIQHNKTKLRYAQIVISEVENQFTDDNNYPEPDLTVKIEESINSLPEKRREIFRLSRQEGLKYHEIAQKLNISIKTVETHMSLAIKTLREKLKNYSFFFTFF